MILYSISSVTNKQTNMKSYVFQSKKEAKKKPRKTMNLPNSDSEEAESDIDDDTDLDDVECEDDYVESEEEETDNGGEFYMERDDIEPEPSRSEGSSNNGGTRDSSKFSDKNLVILNQEFCIYPS